MSIIKNIVVIGGSYVGRGTAQRLSNAVPSTHRVLLIEPHSHFHHLFTFPRFAIVPNEEHKAFIPYSGTFTPKEQSTPHAIVPARVVSLEPHSLKLDRQWQGSDRIEFDYLVVATGSTLTQPSGLPFDQKLPSVEYLRKHQQQVKLAKSILIVGGGAAGVQMATDLKEYYPDKQVTLVHSREHLMPKFHTAFHDLIKKRFDELGINLIAGTRVVVPEGGFSTTSSTQEIKFKNGGSTVADFVILTTGQQPNNSLLKNLDRSLQDSVLNPETGFIRIRPTMQFAHPELSHLFAVGDIADTGAHKAARPGMLQADAVTANIRAMIEGETPGETFTAPPAAIHMTLGMKYNVIFRNPNPAEGRTEPTIMEKQDGQEDMNVEAMWQRLGVNVQSPNEYHL